MIRIIVSVTLFIFFTVIAKNAETQSVRTPNTNQIINIINQAGKTGAGSGNSNSAGSNKSNDDMDNELYSVQDGGYQSDVGGGAAAQLEQDSNGLQDGGNQTEVQPGAQPGGTQTEIEKNVGNTSNKVEQDNLQDSGVQTPISGQNGPNTNAGDNKSGPQGNGTGKAESNLNSNTGDGGKDDIVDFGNKIDNQLGGKKEAPSDEGGPQPGGTTTTIGNENQDNDKQNKETDQNEKQDNNNTQTEVDKNDTDDADDGGGGDDDKPDPNQEKPNPEDPYDNQQRKPEEVMKGADKSVINPDWVQKGKASTVSGGNPSASKMHNDPDWIQKNKNKGFGTQTPASMKSKLTPKSMSGH